MDICKAYPLGSNAASGEAEHLLGLCGRFKHKDPDATDALKRVISEADIHARWVKNESGGDLTPGTIVVWDTGETYGPGRAVGAAAVSGTTVGVGVVDAFLPATGAANDTHFWLVYYGPCQFKMTTGTAVTVGAVLALGAAGRAVVYDHTSAAAQGNLDRCGRALEAVADSVDDDTLYDGFADFRF